MSEYRDYFTDEGFELIQGDSRDVLKQIEPKSIDMVFADPPYFLSGGGISCHSGRQVSVNKGDWDSPLSPEEKLSYNREWISLCRNVLKDDGTIWISGTLHNIYSIGTALELEGFSIINNITWQKPNPAPNLACRCFTHSTETIIWARKILGSKKGHHTFNYELMKEENGGRQMKDVWLFSAPSKEEKRFGHHPTQKPVSLLLRIIETSTNPGDLILDPFNGSGTTGIAAHILDRRYIGIDTEAEYLKLTEDRFKELKEKEDEEGIQ